jgi:hypothetical protein
MDPELASKSTYRLAYFLQYYQQAFLSSVRIEWGRNGEGGIQGEMPALNALRPTTPPPSPPAVPFSESFDPSPS